MMEIKNKNEILLKDKKDDNSSEDNNKIKIIKRHISRLTPRIFIYRYFDKRFDLNEILQDISLHEKEPDLYYNNEISFTKEIDNKIKKNNFPINDSFLNILMIAEKPSIARTITNILSNNEYVEYNFDESINIFAFKGFFKKIYSYFTVTSVKGHLYKNESEDNYDKNYPEEFYEYRTIKTLKKSIIFEKYSQK